MIPVITVDARRAIARLAPSGLPEQVRTQLRTLMPQLGKRVGARVEHKLGAQLKSRNRLVVKKEMIENPQRITVRIRLMWVGDSSKSMVPVWIEEGTRPHVIMAKNAANLMFYWERIGGFFIGPKVNHPGTKAYAIMESTLEEMGPDIATTIQAAIAIGARR